ncbi:endonuclease/exonuclease/phosphatase family protein [uncultured Bartonella sp.]|uniref:endonuclease/exonuclease/phosphatase family protein n=1 Tax=uncultured Bartonella sp. TaxID=104108 RepID=UPI002608FE9B|nr:endonuclease/exonuclease/phosphatase family protein [uncultured Bartonella sp.]
MADNGSPTKSWFKNFTRILFFVTAFLTLPLFASLFCDFHPFFDSLADIRIPLALTIIVLSFPLVLTGKTRRPGFVLIIFAIMAINLSFDNGAILPEEEENHLPVFKLLQTNLRYDNKTPEKLLTLIAKEKPDIVTVQEASPNWQAFLAANGFAVVGCLPQYDSIGATGIMLAKDFAKRFGAISPADISCYKASTTRGYLAKLSLKHADTAEPAIQIVSVHLSWPWPFGQNRQLAELVDDLHLKREFQQNRPTIVAGDFNSVTWSNTVKVIEKFSGTHHIGAIGPTWLSYKLPDISRPLFGLPIDQVLLSPGVRLLAVRRLASIGSDHLPVLVEFQFLHDRN